MLADVSPVFIPILFGASSLIQMYSVMPAAMSDLCVCKVQPQPGSVPSSGEQRKVQPGFVPSSGEQRKVQPGSVPSSGEQRYPCKGKHNLIYATSVCHQVATGFLSVVYIVTLFFANSLHKKTWFKPAISFILLGIFLVVIIPTTTLCTELNQPETSVCSQKQGKYHPEDKDLIKIGFSTSALFVAGTSIVLALIVWAMKSEESKKIARIEKFASE